MSSLTACMLELIGQQGSVVEMYGTTKSSKLGCWYIRNYWLYAIEREERFYRVSNTLLEILEIYWRLAQSPGNFLSDSKFLYFTVYQ